MVSEMKIAMVCVPGETCPPEAYGGIERVVSWWSTELVRQGHHVDLFAREGSTAGTRVIEWPHEGNEQGFAEFVYAKLDDDTDIVVDNTHEKWLGRFGFKNYIAMLHMEHCPVKKNVVGCSRNNAWINGSDVWAHLGVDLSEYQLETEKDDYLLYLGAIAPHKQVHVAIEVAHQLEIPIVIAGPRRQGYENYFDHIVTGLAQEEYAGQVGGERKVALLSNALALLWPINWEEPGGTVAFEAGACGTPVIAYERGCAGEIIEDGVTGFLVHNPVEMADAVGRLDELNPQTVYDTVAAKYNMELTVEKHLAIYQRVIDGETW
jgi:glycosyltransferase involved in cell wall biosynthesis